MTKLVRKTKVGTKINTPVTGTAINNKNEELVEFSSVLL